MIVPFSLKYLHLGICQVAADNVGDSTPVVVYFKVTSMLRHDLLEILKDSAGTPVWANKSAVRIWQEDRLVHGICLPAARAW